MVSCNICGEEFSRSDSLSRHLKRKYSCKVKNNGEFELTNNPKQQSDVDDEHEDDSDLENMDIEQGGGQENYYVTENDIYNINEPLHEEVMNTVHTFQQVVQILTLPELSLFTLKVRTNFTIHDEVIFWLKVNL